MAQRAGLHDRQWEQTQIKVFSRWVAKHLKTRGMDFQDVTTEFSDGVRLINLLEVLGKEEIGQRYSKAPKMRVQMLENATIALNYITKNKGIRLVGIGSDDIVDKNLKLTLGLTWSIINKFLIEEISVEEATARDALLVWAKKNTQGYEGVNITNFSSSWSSGLAFCALINKFRPQLLDFEALDKTNSLDCCVKAFDACRELGIFVYLDPEDVANESPDEKSIVTQVAELFHFFASDSKVGAMADKLKRTIKLQRELEDLKNAYAEEAAIAKAEMEAAKAILLGENYDQTVPSVTAKLVEVIAYGRVNRPKIVETRGKALTTWAALITKSKSTGRPLPVAPEGLAPEVLNALFSEVEGLSATKREELKALLKKIQNQKVSDYDALCEAILAEIRGIDAQTEQLTGTLSEQRDLLNNLREEAGKIKTKCTTLTPPYTELVELKLNGRAKETDSSVTSEAEQLDALLYHLYQRNKAALFEEANQNRINAYNVEAGKYVEKVHAFEAALAQVDGTLEEKRTALLAKQKELGEKRAEVADLQPLYNDLEKDGLHIGLENTPASITGTYTNILQNINNSLAEIFKTMVNTFDEKAQKLLTSLKQIIDEAIESQNIKEGIEKVNALEAEVPELDAPYNELKEFNLNFKVSKNHTDVRSEFKQALSNLKHRQLKQEVEATEADRTTRIEAYEAKATVFANKGKELEASIDAVEGDYLSRRDRLFQLEKETTAQIHDVNELTEQYEDLVKDELHLEIDHTPTSLAAFFQNIVSHISTLVREIDQAIAAEKGLEISEEQLSEFRETFTHFDKDNTKTLEYYELKACLTALGESSTDDECRAIIAKYANGANALDFDGYVKVMLDRFSKAETAESTTEAFTAIAKNSPVVTEEQLAQYFSPEDVEFLKSQMTPVEGGYDAVAWAKSLYA